MHSKLVVLGGGPGGYAAAFMAADLGMEVALVESEPRLGGTCLLKGCIPSKALLHVAKVIAEARDVAHWGVSFPKPHIEIGAMRSQKEKVIQTLSNGLKQLAKQRNVKVIRGRGAFQNSQTLRLEGSEVPPDSQELTFDHCVLAVGSVPAKIPAFDLPTPRIMDSTDALELPELPQSLLVVGGGYIGLEMGTVYAELGSKVSVVELTPGLLPGADRDLVKPLHARLEKLFAGIFLETKVVSLADKGDAIEVRMQGPGGERTERYQRVLVSVGRRPNSRGIGLENTQVQLDERGFVKVDRTQRTADPHILAIGDVAGEPMLAHKATHEGKVAVEALHGGPAEFDALAIPAIVFTDPEVAWAGITEEQARREGRQVEVTRYPWAASGRAQALGRTEGLTKMIVEPQTERVLGIGVVGAGAGDLVAESTLAIEMGATVRDITETVHAHPTLSETIAGAGEMHLGFATEIYRPKREARKRPEA